MEFCSECSRLLAHLAEATEEDVKAATELSLHSALAKNGAYQRLLADVQESQLKVKQVQEALHNHRNKHRGVD